MPAYHSQVWLSADSKMRPKSRSEHPLIVGGGSSESAPHVCTILTIDPYLPYGGASAAADEAAPSLTSSSPGLASEGPPDERVFHTYHTS